MPAFKITLSYDGTAFVGWQRQINGVAVQALVEDALRELDGRNVTVTGAGRTDAGVHALGQVAAFTITRELSCDALVRALNAHLPPAVRVIEAEEAPPGFHPRFDAQAKTYRYRLCNSNVISPFEHKYAWHLPGPLDVGAMAAGAQLLEGRHDFAAFQATGGSVATTERELFSSRVESTVESAVRNPQSAMLEYQVTGSGFLRHMVRIIVGSLVEIGRGRQPPEWITGALAARERIGAGPTAPPHGLFLVRVDYGTRLRQGLKTL